MALKHLPENPRQEARAWNLQLGVPGFKYADLNRVRRLEALDAAFLAALRDADAALAAELDAYRAAAGAGIAQAEESELLLRVAPHVGAFVARLFRIDDDYTRALRARARRPGGLRVEAPVRRAPHPEDARRAAEALAGMDPVELEFAYREVVDALDARTPR